MRASSNMATAVMQTPLGWAGVAVTGKGVARLVLPRKSRGQAVREIGRSGTANADDARLLKAAIKQLQKYLAGDTETFDLPLDLRYYTPFQQAVWKAAAAIPYGETRAYAWVAKRIKLPNAVRAVGQALGANPVPILIP